MLVDISLADIFVGGIIGDKYHASERGVVVSLRKNVRGGEIDAGEQGVARLGPGFAGDSGGGHDGVVCWLILASEGEGVLQS